MYLLAIFLPPLAVLFCGKPIQALLNFFLWCCFIFPGIIHAIMVVSSHKSDKRFKRLEKTIIASATANATIAARNAEK